MEISPTWTFNCFQRQVILKIKGLTSRPQTSVSLLRVFYPLLVVSSLLCIIKSAIVTHATAQNGTLSDETCKCGEAEQNG